jgi:DNA recombination protein RmuC
MLESGPAVLFLTVVGLLTGLLFGLIIGAALSRTRLQKEFFEKKTALETEIAALRQQTSLLEQTNAALSEKLATCEKEKNDSLQQNAAQSATCAQLSERLAQSEALFKSATENLTNLNSRLTVLEATRSELAATNTILTKKSADLEAELKAAHETLASAQARITALEKDRAELSTRLEENARLHETITAQIKESHAALKESFNALAAEALKSNAADFLQQTEQRLEPLKSLLEKLGQSLQTTREQFGKEQGSLRQLLDTLQKSHAELQRETQNLSTALRRPEVRGNWGEMQLRRVIELAGMKEHCDFEVQVHITTSENQRLRPDAVIHLPGGQNIVVDAKTPLDAYIAALNATTENERRNLLARHARQLRDKVSELSTRGYHEQFEKSPEFVILFVPNEASFQAALELEPSLIEEAIRERVLLATPTSLIALLKAAAYGWRQIEVEKNAELIRDTAADIYRALCTFLGHLEKLGDHLARTVKTYNDSVGSLERNLLPKARRLPEMGIHAGDNQLPEQMQIDNTARQLAAPELGTQQQ